MEHWSWIKRRELQHPDLAPVLLLRGSRDHNVESSYHNDQSSHHYFKCSEAYQNTDWVSFQLYEMGGGQRWRFLLGYQQCKWRRFKLVLQTQPSTGRRWSKLWVSNLANVLLLSFDLKGQFFVVHDITKLIATNVFNGILISLPPRVKIIPYLVSTNVKIK
jgi:hypothetical protein